MVKVSIIVPVYNVSPYIERCWDSIRRQTYKNIEVVFVDDCGTDDSISILERLLERKDGVTAKIVHHERNRGLSVARNTGFEASSGDYVYFLDSDDDITPDCIEALVAPLSERKYDVVIGDYNVVGPGGYSPLVLTEGVLDSNKEILNSYLKGEWYVMPWNKLCRRNFLIENRLYFKEGLIHEDVLWSFIMACKAKSMYVVKRPLYNYYVRSSSIMTSMSIEKDLGIYLDVFDEIAKFIKSEGREHGQAEYMLIEGKKSGLMYSLLRKKEYKLYRKAYPRFKKHVYVSPIKAYRTGVIGLGYLLRDIHYCCREIIGRMYKRLFYVLCYKLRGKNIEGTVWK